MRSNKSIWLLMLTAILAVAGPSAAGTEEDSAEPAAPMSKYFNTNIYGYLEAYFEKVMDSPAGVDNKGDTEYESNPFEFDVPDLHVMFQGNINLKYRYYLNLAGRGAGSSTEDASIEVANAWVEMPLMSNYLVFRAGKMYRRFGLYNEILDATPTYIGIEPPELFDKDHLMLTRTTNLMLYGRFGDGTHDINYAIMTGNDERRDEQIPIGADLYYQYRMDFKIGGSFYTTNGQAVPSRMVGEGSPRGGVATWMDTDQYTVGGAYFEATPGNLIIQGAYWQAFHDGRRDPQQVLLLLNAGLNKRQLRRFGLNGPAPVASDVVVKANYTVQTYYARIGYTIPLGSDNSSWTLTPYAQFDYYYNPETIMNKDFGGDGEAGLSDDGKFSKATVGVVLRPTWAVAIKVDSSAHIQQFNGVQEVYPEVRVSISYLWQL